MLCIVTIATQIHALQAVIVALAFLSGTNSARSSYNTFKQLTTSTIKLSKLSGCIASFFACVSVHLVEDILQVH